MQIADASSVSVAKDEKKSFALLRWWHLFSLDAPTVAAVWACLFARIAQVQLRWTAPFMLALGTWLIYIADRLLDGVDPQNSERLRERHYFYLRHRRRFVMAGVVGSVILFALVVTSMEAVTRRDNMIVFLAAILYFADVHGAPRGMRMRDPWRVLLLPDASRKRFGKARSCLPKEAAVGALFAAATAVPAWSGMHAARAAQRWEFACSVAAFAVLCWLNCIAIECWEQTKASTHSTTIPHATKNRGSEALITVAPAICGVFFCLSLLSGLLPGLSWQAPVFLSAALSATALTAMGCFKKSLSPMQLRVGADAALLTPLLFLWMRPTPLFR